MMPSMALLVAILFEDNPEDSYIAVLLDGPEPEILFSKGPAFTKTMGPFPVPYAQATFKRWQYCLLENPPEVSLSDPHRLCETLRRIQRTGELTARYVPKTA
ncbi:MAG: hypothetical protein N3B18_13445 [Desulfobacterota bacterium]|nr:hypothetical protein [Thermodesulfobacteriota bacterium]